MISNFSVFLNNSAWLQGILLNAILLTIGFISPKKVLTNSGLIHAWFLGVLLWICLGWQGYAVIMVYFAIGTFITYVGKDVKEAKGIAENRKGVRGPENLWGSAAVGAVCAIGYGFMPHPFWLLGYVASLSTKLSDTMASEIGKAFGKTTYLITTLRSVAPGTEGAISLEGTVAGIIGSIGIALAGWGVGMIDVPNDLLICLLAAFIATNLESLIGATIQSRWTWLTNEVVNGINTFLGATIAVMIKIISMQSLG